MKIATTHAFFSTLMILVLPWSNLFVFNVQDFTLIWRSFFMGKNTKKTKLSLELIKSISNIRKKGELNPNHIKLYVITFCAYLSQIFSIFFATYERLLNMSIGRWFQQVETNCRWRFYVATSFHFEVCA